MTPETVAYVVGTGWLGGRLLTLVLETTGQTVYTVNQTRLLKKLHAKRGQPNKRSFSTTRDARFTPGKDFNKKAGAYFAVNQTNVIIPAVTVRPNQTLVGLLQEFDSLRQNVNLMLGAAPAPPYAIQRIKPLKKPQEAYFADDLPLIAEPLSSYWQLARHNVTARVGKIDTRSVSKRIRKNFIGLILLLEPFMIGYFAYLAVKFERPEPLALAFAMTVFSLMLYITADRHHSLLQKVRLLFLAPMISWLTYLLALTRLATLIWIFATKTREDWAKWQPQTA